MLWIFNLNLEVNYMVALSLSLNKENNFIKKILWGFGAKPLSQNYQEISQKKWSQIESHRQIFWGPKG